MKNESKKYTLRMRFSEFMMEEWSIDCLCNIALPVTKKDNRDSINIVMTLSSEYGLVAQNDYFGKKLQDLTMNDIYKYNQTILFIMIEQHYYILMEL